MTLEQLVEEMVEFGMSIEDAQRAAPAILPLFQDPRGLREAFVDVFPLEAERRGLRQRQ
jgi:hypothetical protein